MKVIEKIPSMSDNELSRLFANVMDFIDKKKQVDDAVRVKEAIQQEWQRRLNAFEQGKYKAETPEKGVLSTIGYRVIQVLASSGKTLGYMDKATNEWLEDLKYLEEAWGHIR